MVLAAIRRATNLVIAEDDIVHARIDGHAVHHLREPRPDRGMILRGFEHSCDVPL